MTQCVTEGHNARFKARSALRTSALSRDAKKGPMRKRNRQERRGVFAPGSAVSVVDGAGAGALRY